MFDISWTEIMVVAVIAIIVVGPKELPGMLRAFGKTFGQVRRTAREFQSTFNDALREAERQAGIDEVKNDIGKMDPTKDLRKTLDDTKKAFSGKVDDKSAAKPKPKADSDAAEPATAAKPDAATTGETPTSTAAAEMAAAAEPVAVPPVDTTPADDGAADKPRAAAGAEGR
ncbi:Sec-independent protein translocase protein TatB [Acuticoccus sp. MNP-M23]|uniref:Sec-independent protein translocase protein TatB n=1 Tax=Acuticoccus sp. MNP-M23 TaxID=3072793 RepID=UPI002815FA3C|nr:Sec-independent protein translocase protein TatB [Acuticoccus sp. MNP-M23]WMS42415.1 Sec-independent protein translocase protein TatB [Acuticoccus sp. MNP-M23]